MTSIVNTSQRADIGQPSTPKEQLPRFRFVDSQSQSLPTIANNTPVSKFENALDFLEKVRYVIFCFCFPLFI